MHRTYPIAIPIETNRGSGETRAIGPTHITFISGSLFASGEGLRFAVSLRGTATPLEVFGSGRVEEVRAEGDVFVVEASIEQTRIAVSSKDGERP